MGFPTRITSVDGQTGTVDLTKSDVGLTNVDNTSDANKPVSTAQLTAIQDRSNEVISTTWANRATAIAAIAALTPAEGYVRVTDIGLHGSLWWCDGSTISHESPILAALTTVGYIIPSLIVANAATYSQTGTTITVTSVGHNVPATQFDGFSVYLDIATGAATAGWFTNFSRTGANTFECTSTVSQSTSGVVNTNTSQRSLPVDVFTIPANLLGTNGLVDCRLQAEYFNSSNTKSFRLKLGGSDFHLSSPTTTIDMAIIAGFRNISATAQKATTCPTSSIGLNASTAATLSTAIDTTAATSVTASIQTGTASEYAAITAIQTYLVNA